MSLSNEIEVFKMRLRPFLKLRLELIVTENRSTMLNLLEKTATMARLSLHKMFLHAPDPVVSAIAHYVRGSRKEKKERNQVLRHYIQEHLAQGDYTHLINPKKLIEKGEYFDLRSLYNEVNQEYFSGELNLAITWYGEKKRKRGGRITFGQYLSGLRLIKIHRLCDDPSFPDYFLSYVVYHEMLHSVIPGSADRKGRFCFHGHEFKKRERFFRDYERAIKWEKEYFNYGRA